MKPGTRVILVRLDKSKAARITRERWADLADDVLAMGRDNSLHALFAPQPAKGAKTARSKPDTFINQVER
jgi:hypothetical protein